MGNNIVGDSGELALCKIFGITPSQRLLKNSNKVFVNNILGIKKDILKQTGWYNLVVNKYVGGESKQFDFIANNNVTISVKTFKGSRIMVCPQNIGQTTTRGFIRQINSITPNSLVESDDYFSRVDTIKNYVYSNPRFLLNHYVDNVFHADYVFILYNVENSPKFICIDSRVFKFDFANISFSKTIQEWQSSNTIYSDSIPIGSFQLHSNRDCVKFRFDFHKLFQTATIKNNINLYNKDCLDWLCLLPDNSVDLVLIDPPYNVSKPTGFASGTKKGKDTDRFRISYEFGEWDSKDQTKVLRQVFNECYRILRKGGSVVCFYDLWKIGDIKQICENTGFRQVRFAEWVKTNPVPINSKTNYLTNSREAIVTAVKHSKPTFNSEYNNGIYSHPICHDKNRFHTTQKPVKLLEELLLVHSNKDDLVLDCFAGSGSTGVACYNLDRRFIGCEKDLYYYILAAQRLTKHKGNW